MQKKNRRRATKEKVFAKFWLAAGEKIKAQSATILILLVTFIAMLGITFIDYATREAAATANYADYEVGQISDITVIAKRNIVPIGSQGISIKAGEKIIRKGFPITEEAYKKLQAISKTNEKLDAKGFMRSFVYLILLIIIIVLLFKATIRGQNLETRETIFLSVLFFIVYTIASLVINIPTFSSPFALVAVLPCALGSMLVCILISLPVANCASVVMALSVLVATSFRLEAFLFVLISSLAGARLVYKMEKRMGFIHISAILVIVHMVLFFALHFIFPRQQMQLVGCLAGVAFNGFISGVLALGFLTPLEAFLNTVTTFRLMDLSDLNSPIMKHMLLTAPGTYSHSVMVATLAENACREIKANSLLARVGAYYHDLGKLENPEYFVENQTGGNKHDELNPSLSVSIIRRHVRRGVEKAQQLHLPEEVIDIIAEHHGNSVVGYFFNEAKKLDENVSPDDYRYIGNPPSSKEAAVVMLADTVEAACRTLEKPTAPRLEKFIGMLVMKKYEERQLDNSDLTFKELDKIQDVFVNILTGYYHSRIEYPNQKDPDKAGETGRAEKTEKGENAGQKEKENEK